LAPRRRLQAGTVFGVGPADYPPVKGSIGGLERRVPRDKTVLP
jgi:hypothetical protein